MLKVILKNGFFNAHENLWKNVGPRNLLDIYLHMRLFYAEV